MLVAVADEFQSGVPVVDAPGLADDLGLGRGPGLFLALFAAPAVFWLVFEPWVLAKSDRLDRKRLLVLCLAGMAAVPCVAALSGSAVGVSAGIAVWGLLCGIASGIAQGWLVREAASPERAMGRWIAGSVVGDLLAPVLVGGLAALGLGWRAALVLAAVVPLLAAIGVARGPSAPELPEDDEPEEPVRTAIVTALRTPALLAWLLAVAACTLLDEIVLALVALRVDGSTGVVSGEALVFALLAGSAAGGFLAEPLAARVSPDRLLRASAVLSALALVGFAACADSVAQAVFLAILGATCTQHYPLAKAAAYRVLPERPGLVNACDQVLSACDIVAPLAISAVASTFGLGAALLALGLQPLVLLVVSLTVGVSRHAAVDDGDTDGGIG